MKLYFNANNKATLEALEQCGVKNVMLSHRYSYASINRFHDRFDSIFVVAGTKGNPEKYHEFLKSKKEYYEHATQFDVYFDMDATLKYWKQEKEMGIDWTVPVLQGNFLHHIAQLRLEPDTLVCLGEIKGVAELEDQMRKLPGNLRYHGLAKSKFIKNRIFESVDSAAWISVALAKKSEVWTGSDTLSMMFGYKGRGMVPMLRHYCEKYKDNLDKVGITVEEIINCDYDALLKAPIALMFMPQLKTYGFYDENFKQ